MISVILDFRCFSRGALTFTVKRSDGTLRKEAKQDIQAKESKQGTQAKEAKEAQQKHEFDKGCSASEGSNTGAKQANLSSAKIGSKGMQTMKANEWKLTQIGSNGRGWTRTRMTRTSNNKQYKQ